MNEVTLADLLLAAYAAGMAGEPYHFVTYARHECDICRPAIVADKHLRIMIQQFMINNPTKPY